MRLIAQPGTRRETVIACRRVVTLIGSRDGCKICLRHPKVAPLHVVLVNSGTGVYGVDLVTNQGTHLNGLKMEHEALSDGDDLEIGPWTFRVDIEQPTHDTHADLHPFPLDPTPHVAALEHLATGRILQPNREQCVVGRRSGCDITLDDKRVSRTHALLLSYFGHPAVFDLLSQNQTLVNDEPVTFRVLENDDIVAFGHSRFRVRLVGSSVGRRPARPQDSPGNGLSLSNGNQDYEPDEVDIATVEGSQRWSIADRLEKTGRKA